MLLAAARAGYFTCPFIDSDRLCRQLTDTAATTDPAIDDRVDGLETVWDVRGLLSSARSLGGSTVLDEIKRLYSDFGMILTRAHMLRPFLTVGIVALECSCRCLSQKVTVPKLSAPQLVAFSKQWEATSANWHWNKDACVVTLYKPGSDPEILRSVTIQLHSDTIPEEIVEITRTSRVPDWMFLDGHGPELPAQRPR